MRHKSAAIVILCSLLFAACGSLAFHTSANERANGTVERTRASELTRKDLPRGVFIGAALSGGGSRAANFSSAVLLELQELGLLQHVAAISSVSGSSLPAAYYTLYGHDPSRWNRSRLRTLFRVDYEAMWMWRALLPHNWFRLGVTHYDRSDLMSSVFDSVLFKGKTFADFGPPGGLPHLFINATALTWGTPFVFSDTEFRALDSQLSTYPISSAVMASAAFPGVFDNVTLTNWKDTDNTNTPHFWHLTDGGASDNLGIHALLSNLENIITESPADQFKGCYLFIIDAFPERPVDYGVLAPDTRETIDYFVNLNMLEASGLLLERHREVTLREYFSRPEHAMRDLQLFRSDPERQRTCGDACTCPVWHLSFQFLNKESLSAAPRSQPDASGNYLKDLADTVNAVSTRFFLKPVKECDEEGLQDALYEAAAILVRENKTALAQTCRWFQEHGLDTNCTTEAQKPSRSLRSPQRLCGRSYNQNE